MCIPRRLGVRLAVIAVLLSVAALAPGRAVAAGCTGNSHTMTLADGTVAPGSGTTSTDFTFRVVYADSGGCTPDRIVVAIPGVGVFNLSHRRGDLEAGATFGRQMNLPAGNWGYRFEATSGNGPGLHDETLTNVDPPKVRVTAPSPRPTLDPPAPTPEPTKRPNPATPEPTPNRPDATDPAPTPQPSGPDKTPSGHANRTAEPEEATVLPGTGPGGPPAETDGNLAGGFVGRPPEPLPRPVLALLVSTAGMFVGIVLYALLAARLLVPTSRRRVDGDPASAGAPR
jgi:hypothetical protein